MRHYPIFLSLSGARVVVAGGGEIALAKLRLLMKTEADIHVYAPEAREEIAGWAEAGKLTWIPRKLADGDADGARLVYAATGIDAENDDVARIGRAGGALVNVVDDLHASDFITAALVDRDPVTVAIGTEGTAPILARRIKKHLEEQLPASLGLLAAAARPFRPKAEELPEGPLRRAFWAEWYDSAGPRAMAEGGEAALPDALEALFARHITAQPEPGHVDFVGAGPGDPDLLTLKARKALDRADVVIHDRLVSPEVLELARREAEIIDAGKEGFGPSTPQEVINGLIVEHARAGAYVVRLKSGDPTVFGRLDEEIEAVTEAGVSWSVVPGITAASAAVASIGQSLTRRGRNGSVRLMTGHDMKGFAEQDWAALARPGSVAGIYMGKKAARFMQGRLLMHGADPATPVTVVENASRPDQRVLETTLGALEPDLTRAALTGPALVLFGLAPRAAALALADPHTATDLKEVTA